MKPARSVRVDPSVFVVGAPHAKVADPVAVIAVTLSVADPDTLPDVAVIVDVPAARQDARPLDPAALLIAATVVLDELQVTDAVRFCVVPSEYVPIAVNCLVVPAALVELEGVIEIDDSVAGVTVSVVEPDTLPDVAVTVDVPAARQDARPLDPAALLIAATVVLDELQVTDAVRFCVVPSEYVPVAVNCLVVPQALVGLEGVIEIDDSVAEVTVSVVEAVTLPDVAVIVDVPAARQDARPLDPAALLIAATAVLDELQVTDAVRSFVVPSEKGPVAVSCLVVPLALVGLEGVSEIDKSVAGVTVSEVVFEYMLPKAAKTVEVPAARQVARPLDPAAVLIAATAVTDDIQVTDVVRSCVVPSLYSPVATNCLVVVLALIGLKGVTEIDKSLTGFTVTIA